MQRQPKPIGLNAAVKPTAMARGKASDQPKVKRNDHEHAQAEIQRLKRELALAREELDELTEATSDFVRLML